METISYLQQKGPHHFPSFSTTTVPLGDHLWLVQKAVLIKELYSVLPQTQTGVTQHTTVYRKYTTNSL